MTTITELFPEYIGKEQQVVIRGYRYRENLTQRQLAVLTGSQIQIAFGWPA